MLPAATLLADPSTARAMADASSLIERIIPVEPRDHPLSSNGLASYSPASGGPAPIAPVAREVAVPTADQAMATASAAMPTAGQSATPAAANGLVRKHAKDAAACLTRRVQRMLPIVPACSVG